MKLKDIYKDYTIPVKPSDWEDIAKDKRIVKYNRQRFFVRAILPVIVAVVVATVVTVIVADHSSSDKTGTTESTAVQLKKSQDNSTRSSAVPVNEYSGTRNERSTPTVNTDEVVLAETTASTDIPATPAETTTPTATTKESKVTVPTAITAQPTLVPTNIMGTGTAKSSAQKTKATRATKEQENNPTEYTEPETPATNNYEIFIPNAFTPNGDGINDIFNVEANFEPTTFEIAIYSRKGDLMFFNRDIKLGWDGTYRGSACPAQIYSYIVKFTDPDGKTSTKRGQVTLIR